MSTVVLTFMIVGTQDHPLYDVDLSPTGTREQQAQYLHQFVLHAALDSVDDALWSNLKECHLKTVEKFNNLSVTAFVTPGNTRFLLLHDGRNDEVIKTFFTEVYDLYVRVMLNPFYSPTTKITNKEFDKKVRLLAKRILG